MEDAREYLLRIPSFAREKHSLSQAEAFLRELDCPLPGVVIHVAGTNAGRVPSAPSSHPFSGHPDYMWEHLPLPI